MFSRLKMKLVESFVGVIALGWLLAQGLIHLAYIVIAPFNTWFVQNQFRGMRSTDGSTLSANFSIVNAVPELLRAFGLLLLWYLLFYWLYMRPMAKRTATPSDSVQST